MKQEFVDNWRIALTTVIAWSKPLKASAKSPGKRWLTRTWWFSKLTIAYIAVYLSFRVYKHATTTKKVLWSCSRHSKADWIINNCSREKFSQASPFSFMQSKNVGKPGNKATGPAFFKYLYGNMIKLTSTVHVYLYRALMYICTWAVRIMSCYYWQAFKFGDVLTVCQTTVRQSTKLKSSPNIRSYTWTVRGS